MRVPREQWEALHRQVDNPHRNPKAEEALERGREMLAEMKRQGFVRVRPQ